MQKERIERKKEEDASDFLCSKYKLDYKVISNSMITNILWGRILKAAGRKKCVIDLFSHAKKGNLLLLVANIILLLAISQFV